MLHINANHFYLETQSSIIYCSVHRVLWNEFYLLFILDFPNFDILKKGGKEGHVYVSLSNREESLDAPIL